MKLSVIIPTYNRAELLRRALHSVLQQSTERLGFEMEIIVVDDGSVDETPSMMSREFPQVKYLQQSNLGVSTARNNGIKKAQGDWIALLDSDDEWLPDKLQSQFELVRESGREVCHTEEIWIRNGVRVNQMRKHQKAGGWIFEKCLPLCAMSPSSILIHRSVFDQVGLFDETLPACEDYDLWLRICARFPVDFVSTPCIKKYGGHADQLSRQYWGMDRFRVQALDKILQQPLTEEQHQAAFLTRDTKLKILLNGARKHNNQELITWCEQRLAVTTAVQDV